MAQDFLHNKDDDVRFTTVVTMNIHPLHHGVSIIILQYLPFLSVLL